MSDLKSKLIKKYMGQTKTKKKSHRRQGLMVVDQEQVELNSSSQSQSRGGNIREHRRVNDSDEEQVGTAKVKVEEGPVKKSKLVQKGLRKALGLKKGEDVNQFLGTLQVEGIDMKDIEKYLKESKEGITMENKKDKSSKKRIREDSSQKQESEDSDLHVSDKARTIYRDRNQQGTIKMFSKEKQKQMKKDAVFDKLAEWEKGMKDYEEEENEERNKGVDIWDDPLRRWAEPAQKNPLRCPYQGYANRFNIKPGFRWDGVIRGNGFENKLSQEQNLKKLKESQEQREYLKNL